MAIKSLTDSLITEQFTRGRHVSRDPVLPPTFSLAMHAFKQLSVLL